MTEQPAGAQAAAAGATDGMPQPAAGKYHLDADSEFAMMQLDFLDSQTPLSFAEFQTEWERARYGQRPASAKKNPGGTASRPTPQRISFAALDDPVDSDGDDDSRKRGFNDEEDFPVFGARRKPKKKTKTVLGSVPPPKEHKFGDLTKYAPPPKQPATSFMQFSRRYRAGKEKGKAPSAKIVSDIWNSMTDEEKQPYVDLAEEDKRRISLEIDEYITHYPDVMKNQDDFRAFVTALREKEKYERSLGRGSSSVNVSTNATSSYGSGSFAANGSGNANGSAHFDAENALAVGDGVAMANGSAAHARAASPMALSSPPGAAALMDSAMELYDDDDGGDDDGALE